MKPEQRRLIINADDFGLTEGVNRAILEMNAAGVLSSATLMATGAAFSDAVHGAFRQGTLGTGCHLVLLDGLPASQPRDLPTLAPGGELRPTLGLFLRDLFAGRIRPSEIEREAMAQIRRIQGAGLNVTHVDTHKHAHMFPAVLAPLLRAARACGVPAIRNPFEPRWSVRLTRDAPPVRRRQVGALRLLRPHFLRATAKAGLRTTNGSLGVLATGTFNADYLAAVLRTLPPGVWELVTHPGHADDALASSRTRLVESREAERAVISLLLANAAAEHPSIEILHYGDLDR